MSGVQALHETMTADGIVHTYETYDGDHVNRIESRFESRTLPFFAKNLSFGSGPKPERDAIDQGSQPEPKPKAPE